MADALQDLLSPEAGEALTEVTSYMDHPASIGPEYSVSVDPDLSSNVDPIQWDCLKSGLDANNIVNDSTVVGKTVDETSRSCTEPRPKGSPQTAGESVAASLGPAEVEKTEDINVQAGLTNGLQKSHHVTEDITADGEETSLAGSPQKEADKEEQGTRAEPHGLHADDVQSNKEAKTSPKKALANVDLNAEPETIEMHLSAFTDKSPKILVYELMGGTAKENRSSEGIESKSFDFQTASQKQGASAAQEPPLVKARSSPDKRKKDKLAESKKAQVSGKTSKCNRQGSSRKVEGQLMKEMVIKQTKDENTAAKGHQKSSRTTPELQKTNPSKMKTKRSPNQPEMSRDKAAGDYRALASQQGRKKPPSPKDQDLLSDIFHVVRASSKSPSNEDEGFHFERSPHGGPQREKALQFKPGFFEEDVGRRTSREGLGHCRGEKHRSAARPSSSPLQHSTLSPLTGGEKGSLTFQAERKKTRKARNLKLWQFMKRWAFLGHLAATSDLDRYHSNSLDLVYSLVEFTFNLGLATLEIVVGQSAVDRLDSVVTSALTALQNKATALKDTHLYSQASLLIAGFCHSWAGKRVIVVTSKAAETAGAALAVVNRTYDWFGLGEKKTDGVREQGLIKLFLRACCLPVWAYVYFWATILSLFNSTLLSCRDSAARRTGSRQRKGRSGGSERKQSLFSPNPARKFRLPGRWKKRRFRFEEEGEEMAVNAGDHFDEADRMTIVVRSDVRQVKVAPRQNGGPQEEIATALSGKTTTGELEREEAEDYYEESDEEEEEDKEEEEEQDEREETLEAKRRRVAAKENVSYALRVSFPVDVHTSLSPSDGEERWQPDSKVIDHDVIGQAGEGRRITSVRRRLRGGRKEGYSPFHLLGVPPRYNDGARFEDLGLGGQFLCLLRKLPLLSSILRDPREPAPLAYLPDLPTLITDDDTRRLLEMAPITRRDEQDLKRKVPVTRFQSLRTTFEGDEDNADQWEDVDTAVTFK